MILIDGFPYDASLSESHERNSETTKFPVESGADMSDHVRNLNEVITISGLVSDTPIGEVELLRDLEGEGEPIKPSEEAKARLIALRDERRNTTIVTAGGVYENVVMTSFIEKKGPEFTGGLFFDVVFEQRRIITTTRTSVKVKVAAPRISKKVDKGPQSTRPAHIVDRQVNCHVARVGGCAWFDPDIRSWRMGASFNDKKGHWQFHKGALEADGFVGTDPEINKHLNEANADPDSPLFQPGPRVTPSMDGKHTNVIGNPGQTLQIETIDGTPFVPEGAPLPTPDPPLPPESLRQ